MASGKLTGSSNNGRYLYINWSSTVNGANSSSLTANLYLMGDIQGNALSGSYLNVLGQEYSIAGYCDNWGTGTALLVGTKTVTVTHSADGTFNAYLAGYLLYNGSFTSVFVEGYAALDTIPQTPGAPTSCSASGTFTAGTNVSVSWSGASGTITGYEVEYCQYDTSSGWGSWSSAGTTTSTSFSHSITTVGSTRTILKYRVRAMNGSNASSYSPESGYIYRNIVKVWNGSAWVIGTPYVWNGSAWVNSYFYSWNGSNWIYCV